MRGRERSQAVAQRIGAVDELRVAMEVVEVAFEAVDERSGLPVAAGLPATEETGVVCRSGPVRADQSRIGWSQVRSIVDGGGESAAARAAAAVRADIAAA